MISRGAKHFAVLSRRGFTLGEPISYNSLPAPIGIDLRKIRCDVTDSKSVALAIDLVKQIMPAIKEVIQAAMVLRVSFSPSFRSVSNVIPDWHT